MDAVLPLCGCRVDAVLLLAAKYRPFMFILQAVNLAGGVLEIMFLLCTLFKKKELPFEEKKFSIVVDVFHALSEYIQVFLFSPFFKVILWLVHYNI